MEILLFQLMLMTAQNGIYLSFSKITADSHLLWSPRSPCDKCLRASLHGDILTKIQWKKAVSGL